MVGSVSWLLSMSGDSPGSRLDDSAVTMFVEMVETHLSAGGDRVFFRADSGAGTHLFFAGDGADRTWSGFDGGVLEDLVRYGLLSQSGARRREQYRVTADGKAFYRWLLQQRGDAVAQTDAATLSLVRSAPFVSSHPSAAHHLSEAFDLLLSDRLDDATISELGDHLRKALMDVVADIVPKSEISTEQPAHRLDSWLGANSAIGDRERAVISELVNLTKAVLRLDHRLNHVRDETHKGEAPATYAEVRRAAFVTAFTCSQLADLA
jgi:hypothetical protein